MNYKVLFQKLYVVIIVLLAAVVHLAEPIEVIASDASGTADGEVTSFGFNNPTEISGIKILDSSNGAIRFNNNDQIDDLSRMFEFKIQFEVFDLDGFDHLDVYIALFNNDKITAEGSFEVLEDIIDGGVTDRAIVYRWIAPERGAYLSGLSATQGPFAFNVNSGIGLDTLLVKSGTTEISSGVANSGITDFVTPTAFNAQSNVTWETASGSSVFSTVTQSGLVTTLSGTEVISSGVRNIRYQVTIPFFLSKVAPSSGVWNVGVMVHDRLQQEITTARTDEVVIEHKFADGAYGNQFYGEVEILSDTSISFTNVIAGSGGFQTSDQSGLAGIQVRFISNGTYNQSVQTNSTWTPTNRLDLFPEFAYLTANSGLDVVTSGDDLTQLNLGNRFAFRARRTEIGDTEETNLGNNPFVDVLPNGSTHERLVLDQGDTAYRANLSAPVKGSSISVLKVGDPTDEAGINARFEFALRLSQVFQNTSYSGNISIGISNNGGFFNPNES